MTEFFKTLFLGDELMLRLSRFFFGYHLKKPNIFTRGYSSLGNAKGRPGGPSTKENEARVVPDPPGRRAPDGTCFILLVPTHPCYHPSHATISAASSSHGLSPESTWMWCVDADAVIFLKIASAVFQGFACSSLAFSVCVLH